MAEDRGVAEIARGRIARAAECDGTRMARHFAKSERTLYRAAKTGLMSADLVRRKLPRAKPQGMTTMWLAFLVIFLGLRQRTWQPRPSIPDPPWRRI
jgi:hypothetical protein